MRKLLITLLSLISISMNAQEIKLLSAKNFKANIDNKEVRLYTLSNKNGCKAQFTNYGARWISFWCQDREGNWGDVVLGFDHLKGYQTALEGYHGAIVGRICGRINQGVFSMDGKEYKLANNDGFGTPVRNHLHGGVKGFHKKVWDAKKGTDALHNEYLEFTCFSADGEEGFPGNLNVTVRYTLKQDNTMRIDYWGESDKKTLINLTNHAFFNMSGNPAHLVLKHLLTLNCDRYVECNDQLIPTGQIKPLAGSPLDYAVPTYVGQNFSVPHPEIIKDKGIAIAYVLKPSTIDQSFLNFAAKIQDPVSGRSLSIFTNQPSLQVYNAWLMDGSDIGKNNIPYEASAGIAIESQGFPDAPNHPNFPQVTIDKGEPYHHIVEYKFGIE